MTIHRPNKNKITGLKRLRTTGADLATSTGINPEHLGKIVAVHPGWLIGCFPMARDVKRIFRRNILPLNNRRHIKKR